jgi:hypothetical protein
VANVGTNAKRLRISTATTHVLVDVDPPLVRRDFEPAAYDELLSRAELLAPVMASPPVLDRVAARLHVPVDQITGTAVASGNIPVALTDPDSEQRASEILQSKRPYRLEVQPRPGRPIVDIYTQAPSPTEAKQFAEAVISGLREYLGSVATQQSFGSQPVALRQLGRARGGVVNHKTPPAIAVLTFVTVAALTLAILLALAALGGLGRPRAPRASDASEDALAAAAPARPADPDDTRDDWPHTTRVLPWTLAGFVAVLWLTPFNSIELSVGFPIDLKLDRLVLPFVIAAWIASLIAGGRRAPRFRLTAIHAAVAAFVLVAILSVVLDAAYLNQTLELEAAMKRIPVLLSYAAVFFIAATTIRRTEVWAYMRLTLLLAAICSLGMIWEYRFKTNLFYDFSAKLLPGIFNVVNDSSATGVDDIGRRAVIGPAEVGLEAVAMLSMALPIGLVSFMQSRALRTRIISGLVVCLLLAATIATFRKTALVAPLSAIATIAYFRRRELLKLAPLALVLIVVIHALAPGALGSTAIQLNSNRLGVSTVSDRTVDYDAVRPDLWAHLLFGRGWGSYNHVDYRLLDSEILQRLVEMGVIGLLVYLSMAVAVVAAARALINARDPRWSPLALIGAAAAVPFLIASALFDILSFPHATYIFFFMAGLTAVVVAPERRRAARQADDAATALGRAREIMPVRSIPHPHHTPKIASETPNALT